MRNYVSYTRDIFTITSFSFLEVSLFTATLQKLNPLQSGALPRLTT